MISGMADLKGSTIGTLEVIGLLPLKIKTWICRCNVCGCHQSHLHTDLIRAVGVDLEREFEAAPKCKSGSCGSHFKNRATSPEETRATAQAGEPGSGIRTFERVTRAAESHPETRPQAEPNSQPVKEYRPPALTPRWMVR